MLFDNRLIHPWRTGKEPLSLAIQAEVLDVSRVLVDDPDQLWLDDNLKTIP